MGEIKENEVQPTYDELKQKCEELESKLAECQKTIEEQSTRIFNLRYDAKKVIEFLLNL